MTIHIQESYVNATKHHGIGDTDVYDTGQTDRGELFRSLMKEYGRCISKVHVDTEEHVLTIGWVFQKRVKYEDCNETYLQEVWVTLHTEPPTKTTKYHYMEV